MIFASWNIRWNDVNINRIVCGRKQTSQQNTPHCARQITTYRQIIALLLISQLRLHPESVSHDYSHRSSPQSLIFGQNHFIIISISTGRGVESGAFKVPVRDRTRSCSLFLDAQLVPKQNGPYSRAGPVPILQIILHRI